MPCMPVVDSEGRPGFDPRVGESVNMTKLVNTLNKFHVYIFASSTLMSVNQVRLM